MAGSDTPLPAPPTKEELKQAMKAFKKRLKLTRLDEESQLRGGPIFGASGDATADGVGERFEKGQCAASRHGIANNSRDIFVGLRW